MPRSPSSHGDEVNTAFVRAEESTAFEIGSITKVLTGELLAIAVERGEVSLDDTLGEHLDLGDAPVASVPLVQLATHHSGLPHWPEDPAWVAEFDEAYAAHEDPVDDDLAELLELARGADAAPDSEFEYSSFGAALLGQALSSAAGIEYPELLQQRVLDPLGWRTPCSSSSRIKCQRRTPEDSTLGDPVEPWTNGAFSPAGGVDATLGDLIALAAARRRSRAQSRRSSPSQRSTPGRRSDTSGSSRRYDRGPSPVTPERPADSARRCSSTAESGTASIVLTNTASQPRPFELALRLLVDAER